MKLKNIRTKEVSYGLIFSTASKNSIIKKFDKVLKI